MAKTQRAAQAFDPAWGKCYKTRAWKPARWGRGVPLEGRRGGRIQRAL